MTRSKHVETDVAKVRRLFEQAKEKRSVGQPAKAAELRADALALMEDCHTRLGALSTTLMETLIDFGGRD